MAERGQKGIMEKVVERNSHRMELVKLMRRLQFNKASLRRF